MNPIELAQQEIKLFYSSASISDIENVASELQAVVARHDLVLSTSNVIGASIGARRFGAGFVCDNIGAIGRFVRRTPLRWNKVRSGELTVNPMGARQPGC